MTATGAPAFTGWLDDFFAEYYLRRPVNATFIGVHDFDAQLPDFSENGVGDTVAGMETLLARAGALPREPLSAAEAIDGRLAEGFLRIQLWECGSRHFQRGNPCAYTGEAAFGVIGLFLTPFAPPADRVAAATERLHGFREFFDRAQDVLRSAPAAWTERALRECQGLLALLDDVDRLLVPEERIGEMCGTPAADALGAAAHEAAMAVAGFRDYLEGLFGRAHATANYACGAEAFDLYLRQGHCLDLPAPELLRYAEDALAETEGKLAAGAAAFGARTWQGALARLADLHPTGDGYYPRFGEVWEACRGKVAEQKLLTWPDFPIEYVPQPGWARGAAPYLYFLNYRAPAAFGRPAVHRYLVPPLDPALSPAGQESFLRGANDAVIKLNHVVHHGGPGHHVQNWHAYRAASRIGQVAAVDCASRIAMFCGGTMAEGWACYATELMDEAGFLTPLESFSELQTRLRMAVRAVVDCRLHAGALSLDEAAAIYRDRAGMAPEAARAEAVKNSMFPGAAMMYLVGADQIHELRRELAAREGDAFNLARFHDRFLSYGSIPVPLICASMRMAAGGAPVGE